MAFFSTDASLNLKLIKVPQVRTCSSWSLNETLECQGPTVSFKVVSYSLVRDVQRTTRKLFDVKHSGTSSPLVVMTNFQKSKHHSLVVTLVQNLFPSVNPHTVEIKNKKRVVLFDYDAEHDLIRFRHYRISIPASGLSNAMKTLLYGNGLPDLGDLDNMSEFLSKSGCASVL